MEVTLVLVQKDERQRDIKISKPRTMIGRQTDCTIRVPVPAVSRQHCELIVDDDEVTIRDLKSGNGTYVNRKRVTEQVLSPGDLVALGPVVFVVRLDGKPAKVSSEDALRAGSAPEPAATADSPSAIVTKPTAPAKSSVKSASAAASKKPAEKPATPTNDPDDSSLSDFDFLDDNDDSQPKL